jgi:DNA invertase Pin-like site-specific DNA recombinase
MKQYLTPSEYYYILPRRRSRYVFDLTVLSTLAKEEEERHEEERKKAEAKAKLKQHAGGGGRIPHRR